MAGVGAVLWREPLLGCAAGLRGMQPVSVGWMAGAGAVESAAAQAVDGALWSQGRRPGRLLPQGQASKP